MQRAWTGALHGRPCLGVNSGVRSWAACPCRWRIAAQARRSCCRACVAGEIAASMPCVAGLPSPQSRCSAKLECRWPFEPHPGAKHEGYVAKVWGRSSGPSCWHAHQLAAGLNGRQADSVHVTSLPWQSRQAAAPHSVGFGIPCRPAPRLPRNTVATTSWRQCARCCQEARDTTHTHPSHSLPALVACMTQHTHTHTSHSLPTLVAPALDAPQLCLPGFPSCAHVPRTAASTLLACCLC